MAEDDVILETSSSLVPAVTDLAASWVQRWRRRHKVATASASAREVLPVGRVESLDILPWWLPSVVSRVDELRSLPDGWDTYGGRRLDIQTARSFLLILRVLAPAVQSQPRISITSNGGLLAGWSSGAAAAEIGWDPGRVPEFSFSDDLSGVEWDGPLTADDPRVEKWLWQASA